MAHKWYDFGIKSLPKGDSIERTYDGRLNDDYGHLMLSKTKILFVKEEGLLRKNFSVTLNLPYEKIEEVNAEDQFKVMITKDSGERYWFLTDNIPISIVKATIEELMRNPQSPVPIF